MISMKFIIVGRNIEVTPGLRAAVEEKIGKLRCDEEVKTHLLKECDKLAKMPQGSHEATVVRNYLDKCLEIPFGTYTKDNMRLDRARKVLDKDHYGLDKVKDRIVESLAVLRRNPDIHWILWDREPDFPAALQNATDFLTAHGLG